MKTNLKQRLIIAILLPILSLLTCLAYAENVEEIIEAQEELNTTSNEENFATVLMLKGMVYTLLN